MLPRSNWPHRPRSSPSVCPWRCSVGICRGCCCTPRTRWASSCSMDGPWDSFVPPPGRSDRLPWCPCSRSAIRLPSCSSRVRRTRLIVNVAPVMLLNRERNLSTYDLLGVNATRVALPPGHVTRPSIPCARSVTSFLMFHHDIQPIQHHKQLGIKALSGHDVSRGSPHRCDSMLLTWWRSTKYETSPCVH